MTTAAPGVDADAEAKQMPDPRVQVRGQREERVVHVADLEVRADDSDNPSSRTIVGHPLLYNVWSEDLGGFRERIRPGAPTKTLKEADIRALFNHDPNYVLGRNRAGTLELTEQAKGVQMRATPPDTSWAADLIISMERKDIDQMSFGFRAIRDEWKEPKTEGGLWDRDLLEIQLFDVSVVTFPAYVQTDAQVRSILSGAGIDFDALTALLGRAQRGLSPSSSDVDLLNGSIAVLRSFIPSAPEPVTATTQTTPDAGRTTVHLRTVLELEAALI